MEGDAFFRLEGAPWSAMTAYGEAREALRAVGERRFQLVAAAHRAKELHELGDLTGAEAALREAFAQAEHLGETTPLVAASPDHSVVYKVRNGPRIGTYTIYASHDAGATWRQLGATQYGNPGALLVDPADPSDLYVAGDSDATGPTMIESRNAGATWSVVDLPAPVTALAGDPKNPGRLWLGGPDGLWVSDDSGRKDTRLQQVPVSALAALPGNRLVVGGFGLFVSSDGGVKLRPARQPDLDLSVSALLASPAQPDTLYAATGPFHTAGLLKGGHGVFRSTNDGRTWQPFSSGLTDLDVLSLAIAPDGRTLYAGTQRGGVYALSLDGGKRRI